MYCRSQREKLFIKNYTRNLSSPLENRLTYSGLRLRICMAQPDYTMLNVENRLDVIGSRSGIRPNK